MTTRSREISLKATIHLQQLINQLDADHILDRESLMEVRAFGELANCFRLRLEAKYLQEAGTPHE